MDDGKNRANKEGEIKTQAGQAIPIRANYMALKNEEGRIVGGFGNNFGPLPQVSIRERYKGSVHLL